MEIRVICDCSECSSRLVEIGGVNILCNLPTKLLRECDSELSSSIYCDSENSCSETLYNKLLCLEIHIIIATTPRGLDGFETLRSFYDVASAHIVCTRPVYTIASLALPQRIYDCSVEAIPISGGKRVKIRRAPKRNGQAVAGVHQDGGDRSSEAHPEGADQTNGSCAVGLDAQGLDKVSDDMSIDGDGNDHLNASAEVPHSYGNPVGSDLREENERAMNWVRTRSNHIKNSLYHKEFSSGGSFGPDDSRGGRKNQSYLKDPDLPYREHMHAVSYNEVLSLEISRAGGQVPVKDETEEVSETDRLLGRSALRFTSTIEICGYSSGFGMGSSNWLIKHQETETTVAIVGETGEVGHGRFCTPVDLSFTDKTNLVVLLDNAAGHNVSEEVKVGDRVKRGLKAEDGSDKMMTKRLDSLCQMAFQGLQNPEGVVVVTDPYADTLLDILEHMHVYMMRHTKQHQNVYMYAFGEGVVELLVYADKCAEWVAQWRAELTMHHENPSSPFPIISQMKEENRLFVGNSVADIKDVYRFPSVVIVTYEKTTLPYLKGRLYAGANIITTSERYRDELVKAAAEELGVESNVTAVDLDFRAHPDHLIQLFATKCQLVVSSRMKSLVPRSLKVLVGDVVTLPSGMATGLLHVDIGKADIRRVMETKKTVGEGALAAALDVRVDSPESIKFLDSNLTSGGVEEEEEEGMVVAAEGKFTFGHFTVQQLLEQLEKVGLPDFKPPDHAIDGYPIEIVGDDGTVILLESQYETCIETASEERREKIMQALEQLLTSL